MLKSGEIEMGGEFTFRGYDVGGTLLWTETIKNLIPNAALTNALSVVWGAGAQTATWFMGLVDNAGFTGFVPGDTAASHPGWSESVAYTESVRQTVVFGAASGNNIATSASCTFTINGTVSVKGAFLSSSSVKSGAGGLLGVEAALNNIQGMSSGQTLKIDYNCSSASS